MIHPRFKARVVATILLCLTALSAQAMSATDEMALIRERYIDWLRASAPAEETIHTYLELFDWERGAWSDIDYESQVGSGWKTKQHTERTVAMAMFYRKYEHDLPSFTHNRLSQAIHKAWEYWFTQKPYCTTNWFPNLLSCPRDLGYSFVLMQEEMSQAECDAALAVVFSKVAMDKTGSNLIWLSNNVLLRSLFVNDVEMARKAIASICSTLFVSDPWVEGIQQDYSYLLHDSQQQFGNYGKEALVMLAPFSHILRGTSFGFPTEKMEILTNFVAEGYGWVLWRGYLDMNSSGRQYGNGMLREKGTVILDAIEMLSEAGNDEQRTRMQEVVRENRSDQPIAHLGQKSFYCADGMYHRTPHWMASLKMHSTRVYGGEQGNDNIKGFYSGDGAFYTWVEGDEYENSPVLWNWRRVPGITCYDSTDSIRWKEGLLPRNRSNFVGTCTDGKSGISTMVIDRDGIRANKSWVVTDDFALCLGSGINDSTQQATLTTAIDQKIKRGTFSYLAGEQWRPIAAKQTFKQGEKCRLHHDQTGYIVLEGMETEALVEHRTQNWADISRSLIADDGSPNAYSNTMIDLYIRHKGADATYQYLILPATTPQQVAVFDTHAVRVLSNTPQLQLVEYKGTYYMTAFEKGNYNCDSLNLQVHRAGIFLLKAVEGERRVVAHDPTKELTDEEMATYLTIQ